MANVTIYVSSELRQALNEVDIPISAICSGALWDAVTAEGHRRPGAPIPGQLKINQEKH